MPLYASDGAAGADLFAAESAVLAPLERRAISTGIAIEIPPGFEAQVRPRSGLAIKKGVTMVNSPGTIDSDYRGEIKVLAINLSSEPVSIEKGDRIGQLVFARCERAEFEIESDAGALSATARGTGGFGSTGGFSSGG